MKKWYLTSFFMLIIGVVIAVAGYFGGGRQAVDISNFPHVQAISQANSVAQHQQWQDTGSFKRLTVDVNHTDVVIKTGKHAQVDYKGNPNVKLKVTNDGETLSIKQVGKANAQPRVQLKDATVWGQDRPTQSGKLIITVTKAQLAALRVNTHVTKPGDLEIWNVKVKQLTAVADEAVLENVESETTKLTAADDITIDNPTFANTANVLSKHGDIDVSQIDPRSGYQATATAGDVELFNAEGENTTLTRNPTAKTQLHFTAMTGDVSIRKGMTD
ncbi:MAG: DUF4097 domain-containing protein [Limosilactobacillus sp.]|nr:DUF4097 domain-containing protein [Limosilactobacillus sp.]